MSIDPTSTNSRPRAGFYEIRIIAWLLGLGCGLHLSSIAGLYHAMLDPLPQTTMVVVCVALLSAAVGPWLPQSLLGRWLRIADTPSDESRAGLEHGWMSAVTTSAQQGLMWVALAVACILAGTTALLLLWATGPIESLIQLASGRFFLSRWELLALDTVTVATGVAVPWMLVGVAVACLYALQSRCLPLERIGAGVVGSLLMAAGIGAALSRVGMLAASPPRTALIGALPWVLAAVIAVVRAGERRDLDAEDEDDDVLHLPECAPEAGYALLSCLGIGGAIVGGAVAVWPRALALDIPFIRELPLVTSGWILGWVGVGVLFGGMIARRSASPISEAGPGLVAAGAAGGVAIAVNALLGAVASPVGPGSSVVWLVVLLATLAFQGGALGWAVAYLRRSILIQAGTPTMGTAQAWSTLLVGGAVGLVVTGLWLVPSAGSLVALATGALSALAAGGLLVIFDVGGPSRFRTRRLIGVFAVLLVFMIVLPGISGRWLATGGTRTLPREGAWFTVFTVQTRNEPRIELRRSVRSITTPSGLADMSRALGAVMALRDRYNAALVLSAGDIIPSPEEQRRCAHWEIQTYDPVAASAFERIVDPGRRITNDQTSSRSGLRALRLTLDQYDLIAVSPIPGGHCLNQAVWSVEVLSRLRRALAREGILAGFVRPADYSRSDLAALVATFVAATANRTYGGMVGEKDDAILVLLATESADPPWRWTSAAAAGLRRIGPLRAYLQIAHGIRPNSLRNPSLSDLGRPPDGGLELARFVSTSPSWREIAPSSRPITILPPNLVPGGE